MIVLLFFGGFIDVGGEWFQMWRSTTWTGLDTAFRNAVFAIATLILIQLPLPSSTMQTAQQQAGAQTKREKALEQRDTSAPGRGFAHAAPG